MSATPMSPEVRLAAFALWYNGMSLIEIAKNCDVSKTSVERWIVQDKWKDQREVLRRQSCRYAIESLVSHKNEGVGVFLENFKKIMKNSSESAADETLSVRERKDAMSMVKTALECVKLITPDGDETAINRRSGTTSAPIQLTNVKEDIIDAEYTEQF